MSDKLYRVKVTEKHSGYVDVRASSAAEAKDIAAGEVECEFESTYDCEIVNVTDINEEEQE